MARSRPQKQRNGAIVPLTAVMLIVFIGMLAFSIDTNWMVLTKAELQNSADASALAGAQQLVNNYSVYAMPGQTTTSKNALAAAAATNARSTAKTYGAANGAGGLGTLTYLDSDVEIGFTNADGVFTAYTSGGEYPNTVRTRGRRDDTANSPLGLFFGPVLGLSKVSLTAPATATLYVGTVNSFQSSAGAGAASGTAILPMTYDASHWDSFVLTGKDADGATMTDSSGNPKLQIYPSVKYAGNFGQLSLNDGNVGTSTMRDWVTNGCSPADIGTLTANGLLPLSSHDPTKWDWQGSTGFTSSLIQCVNDNVGKTVWLPLFKAYNSSESNYQAGVGKGSNFSYNIVAFVPVKIVQPSDTNRQVVVQPGAVIDAAAVFSSSSIKAAGTTSWSSTTAVMAPRLSN